MPSAMGSEWLHHNIDVHVGSWQDLAENIPHRADTSTTVVLPGCGVPTA